MPGYRRKPRSAIFSYSQKRGRNFSATKSGDLADSSGGVGRTDSVWWIFPDKDTKSTQTQVGDRFGWYFQWQLTCTSARNVVWMFYAPNGVLLRRYSLKMGWPTLWQWHTDSATYRLTDVWPLQVERELILSNNIHILSPEYTTKLFLFEIYSLDCVWLAWSMQYYILRLSLG